MLMDASLLQSTSHLVCLHILPGSCRKDSNLLEVDFYPVSQSERVLYPCLVKRLVVKHVASGPNEVSSWRTRKGQIGI